ncbi:MAG: glycoside hydrolase family 15 protein [Syntrophobacterales bacterium]|nr:glycoside hydrolase family 15 protein [Syntrophobacterales bacterium]
MPRDLPLSNGRLLVCFDRDYCLRDLYFPHVGQENHVLGARCRLGVWVDGRFSWVGEEWRRELLYAPDTLVTDVRLYHDSLQLLLRCRDAVDFHEDVWLREVEVENLAPDPREVRLFFSLDLSISGNNVGDTAAFDPKSGGLLHYKGARYFLANAWGDNPDGLEQFAVGEKGLPGKEGTWRDAEDGLLSGNPIAQGSVDSVLGVSLTVPGMDRRSAYFWLAAGENRAEVQALDRLVKSRHPARLLKRTADYWTLWIKKESPPLGLLPAKVGELYHRSLLILRTQTDAQGGILAGNDSDVIHFNRDTYSYVWPRDGALVAHALDLAGHPTAPRHFFRFMARLVEPEGCLLHKYNPDGTLASSWHPWYEDGQPQLPIQEDSTALVVWALWHHFVSYRDLDVIKPLYRPLVKKAAEFMCAYRDPETGLPAPSYDLWEERRGISGFTVGAVFGGLTAAALFCMVFGEEELSARYRQVAAEIRDAASQHLWRPEAGRFCRMLHRGPEGTLTPDLTPDASLWGLFAFGLYAAEDPRIAATLACLRERLWVPGPVGGMARYEGDPYHRVSPEGPGNPWFLCTLWLADYLLERGDEAGEEEALGLLTWVADHALPSGVLAEQLHPLTGEPLSVSPLTWSHATYVTTLHRLLKRRAKKGALPEAPAAFAPYLRPEDWIERLYAQTCDSIHGLCKL